MDNIIEVKELEKKFGRFKVLKGINFSCKTGDILGFLGPNGAGKTTTIRCMVDLIRPSKGQIKILGQNANKCNPSLRRRIGFLPADIDLYDNWTGEEHINFVADIKGSKAGIKELKQSFDLDFKKKSKYLSTGNRQKLGIIMALLGNPELLILDEPTKGLDPIYQNQFYQQVLELNKAGTTIFMSSHNLIEVAKVCNKVAIIRMGELIALDSIKNLKDMSIRFVTVYFHEKPSRNVFMNMPDVEIYEDLHKGFVFKVKGEVNELIQLIAKYTISDLDVSNANLEEIFFEYYRK